MITEIIKVLVRPNASKNSVAGIYGDYIRLKISSPPEKGKANKELLKFISLKLEIPKNDIKIISGLTSNKKIIEVKKETNYSLTTKLLDSF